MSRGLWFAMSARTRRSLTVLWTALFLCSLALQYVQLAAPASVLAVHDEGLFELDGNAQSSGASGDDWEAVFNGTDSADASVFITDGVPERSFTGGGSKDDLNTSQWQHTSQSVPDKDDILHAFAAIYGDFLYYGGDRFQISGDAQIGFWFFKNGINANANGTFTPVHTVGDLLVLSHFSNGGTVSTIELYEWVGSGGDTNGTLDKIATGAQCTAAPADDIACAMANSADSNSPWSYTPKSGDDNVFGPNAFFEGGLDLADLYNGNPPCFSSFLVETRASTSIDSTLQDFATGAFNTCVPPTIATQVQQNGQNVSKINKGESVVDVATFSGDDGAVSGTVDFFVCGPDTNSKPACTSGGTKVGATKTISAGTATSDAFTPSQLGWYCFRAEYTPDAASQYLAGKHTNDTTECFRVIPADVQIVKTPNDGSANAGETISFNLSWANEGEGAATGVVVTDPLPTGNGLDWSITGFTGTGSTCQITAGDSVTCTIGTIAGNPNFPAAAPVNGTVTLSSPTTAATCGVIDNTGQITSGNDGTDTDPGKITVLCPDVNVVKTPNDGQVNAGDPASFSIKVTNAGPGTATGVSLSDPLPSALAWALGTTTGDTTGVTCSVTGAVGSQTLACADASMTAGQSFTVTVTTTTSSAQCATFPNVATVDATNESNDPSVTDDNTDPGAITVNCPDVQALKTADNSPVNAGDQIGFVVTIKNNGTGTAYGATGSDLLPTGIAWSIDGAANGWSIVGGELKFGPADLAPGASASVHIVGTTDAADCGVIPNTVTVDATNESNAPALTDDNSATANVTVTCPDVQALKSAIKSPVNAGDQIGFTVTIKNNGTGTAYGATGSDTLPSGIAWSISGAANGWTLANGVLTFGPADLAPGASASVTIVGTTDAADCAVIPNTVTVDAANESNDAAATDDNGATATVTVECPDLDVDKVADDGTISAGEVAAFSIVITNIGDGTAYAVSLTDTLPSGVAWDIDEVAFDGVAVADPDALCSISGVSLSCPDLGSLAPDAEISIAVSGDTDLDDCGTLLNSVVVDATNESNAAAIVLNNSAMASVVVDCPALAIDKDADHVDPVIIGGQIGFTITIKNNGAGTAFGVTVADTLDPDFTWSIATPSTGWSLIGNALSFSGNLAAGATSTVHVVAPTTIGDSDQCGLVPNTAVLDHSSIDPTPASASEAVRCPDTDITKTADDDLVEPNQTVTYTITVKVVDGPVTNAVVTDTLPVGQTYVTGSASPAPASVSPDGRTITWTYASLATGDPAATITYDVTIDADATGAAQQNRAELCVAEAAVDCVASIEIVTPQRPAILLVKTAGTAADGAVFETKPGPVTYTYQVTNTGPLTLFNVTVTDDAGTPGTPGDDFTATCPKTTLAPAESMTCTVTKTVLVDTTNIAVARGVTAEGNPAQDDDDAKVVTLEYSLVIDKSNDAPLETLELPDGSTTDLPTADEGDIVTYTLAYTFAGDPVTIGIITDVLPVGVTYVAGSAIGDAQFTFQSYNAATRTLTWTAPGVNKSGSVSYQAKVDVGASELPQPLINVAAIDSDQTPRDDDDSPVFVPTIPLAATGTPRVTLPPTDILDTPQSSTGNLGFNLMLILLALAAAVIVIGFVTPVPASVRERPRR